MRRKVNRLKGWQSIAIALLAVLLLQMSMAYEWLQAHEPPLALTVLILGYSLISLLFAYLAWGSWMLVFAPRNSISGSVVARLWLGCFASMITIGTVVVMAKLVREILGRTR